ncbi:peptidylprolyl isomerase [Hyphococcus sp. DH-69]|uniref:peptidylprolyl isomerase n=1 Tax=Hyphococcus formosus TaxID=3143534 RepID=UPI00398AD28E
MASAFAQAPESEERPTSDEVIARSGVPASAVAAVVNDSVVTTFDVRQRMKMMVISSGGKLPQEAFPQLQAQALRDLIEERLKLQETRKYELQVTDEEINDELNMMAAQSGLTLKQMIEMLEGTGVSIKSLREQIRAQIAWPQLVQGRYRDRVRVSEDEIENTLERMREDASKEQYLVSEICIPVDNPSQAQQYYQGSMQLIEQMRRGVPFSVVAQQFSACTTAAVGGDLGWVRSGELSEELDAAIRDLPPGSVTNPIPSEGAFMILAVRDKRQATEKGEPTFTLAYAAADESLGNNAARAALDKIKSAELCSGRSLRIDLGKGVGYSLLENVTLDQIDERFRPHIEDLSRDEQSPVIKADNAYHSAYVCDKDEGLGLPSREALENRIYSRQLARIAQQYLRDVERDAMVDVRMKSLLQSNG